LEGRFLLLVAGGLGWVGDWMVTGVKAGTLY